MKSLYRKLLYLTLPLLIGGVVFTSCDDDEAGTYSKPKIEAIAPGEAKIGTQITISGSNLSKVNRVDFANIQASAFTATDNTITVTVPAGLPEGDIMVAVYYPGPNEKNLGASDNEEFVVLYEPLVSSIDVSSAKPTKQVVITGSSLQGTTAVTFGDQLAAFEAESKKITATVPDMAAGEVTVSITTPGGTTSIPFTVMSKTPEIHALDTLKGRAGEHITVTGLFFDDVHTVEVNGLGITEYEVVSPTEIVFTIPSGATSGKVKVTTALGSAESEQTLDVIATLVLPYAVYEDGLNETWQKWDGWGTAEQSLASTEQAIGTSSIKIAFAADNAWGGFQLHPTNPDPFSLEGASKIKMSIYGGPGSNGSKVALYIKKKGGGDPPDSEKKEFTLVEGEFTTFEALFSELGNPPDISEFVIQNRGTAGIVVYIDNIIIE